MYPESVRNLITSLRNLPGIGEKTAERMAFSILNFNDEKLEMLEKAIVDIKNIGRCSICNNITDQKICSICSNPNRVDDQIFVVEKPRDIILFEKMGNYSGKYHVLDGLISPIDGINPEDINIENLEKRVKKGNIKELIIVLKPSIEGETTMHYIGKILSKYDVKISKMPIGIPIGADIEYIDSMTLEMAFEDRQKIE